MAQPLKITTLTLGEMQTNCYLASCTETGEALVIDPADSGDVISEHVLAEGLTVTGIVLTHGHFDHCLGLLELLMNFTAPTYLHHADQFLIQQAQASAAHWLKHSVDPIPLPTDDLTEGMTLTFGKCSLNVIETPGHTPGSICLSTTPESTPSIYENKNTSESDILFTGDTLFKSGITRTDFRYSNVLTLYDSLKKLQLSSPNTHIYPGHGEPAALAEALAFLQEM